MSTATNGRHRGKVIHYRVAWDHGDIPYERFEQAVARAVSETTKKRWRHQVRRVKLGVGYRWIVQRHGDFYGFIRSRR